MSARATLYSFDPCAHSAKGGPVDLAGTGFRNYAVNQSSRLLRFSLVATVLLAAATSFAAVAPPPVAAHLSGALFEQTIGSGFQQPEQIAVDASGNLYVADFITDNVYKETLAAGVYTQSVFRSGLNGPIGVAVDGKNNVYIADTGSPNSRILKETPSNEGSYSESTLPTTGLSGIVFDLAVDAKGSVYIADALNNRVVKLTVSGETYTQSVITTSADGILGPEGVAVDPHGDVYIADTENNRVVMETLSGNTYTQSVVIPVVVPLGLAGVNAPGSLTYAGGALYVADSFNDRILKVTYDSTTKVYTKTTVSTGTLNAPQGVAVDGSGNVYIADTNDKRVAKDTPGQSTNFGAWPVASKSTAATLTFTFDSGGKIGAPAIKMLSPGLAAFTNTATGTCIRGTAFATGKTCTLLLTFKPNVEGFAFANAELTNSGNNVIASAEVFGTGVGSRLLYPSNGSDSTIGTALKTSSGVAIDLSENVYVADTGNDRILKEVRGTGGTYTQSVVAKSLSSPTWIAVDASGDVFFNESGTKSIIEETPGTGSTYTQTVVYGVGASSADTLDPGPIAVDRDGNLWVSFPGKIQEFTLASGTWKAGTKITIDVLPPQGTVPILLNPVSLAVDWMGNVYVGESNYSTLVEQRILKFSPGASGYYAEELVEEGTYPTSIAADSLGNLYVVDNADRVHVFVPTGIEKTTSAGVDQGSYLGTILATQTSLSNPIGIAADTTGGVYIANAGSSKILRETWGGSPSFLFGAVQEGQSSGSKSQSLLEIGNTPLSLTVPSTGQNPTLPAAYSLNSSAAAACPVLTSSSEAEEIAPGVPCTITISFSPPSTGSYPGSLTYQYTVTGGTTYKTIFPLGGTGIAPVPTITWPAPAPIAYGTALSATQLDATASYNGNNVPGTFTYTPALGAVLGGGTQTLKVTFVPSGIGYSNASASVTIDVTPVPLFVVADSFSRIYGSPNPAFTLSYIGLVNGDTQSVLRGAAVLSVEATPQFPWGYYPITVTPGNLSSPNYSLTFVDGTLVITQAPLTVTAGNVEVANSGGIPNPYPCSFTGLVNGDTTAVVSGVCGTNAQNYANSPAGTYTVTPAVGNLSALNYYFSNFVPGTLTIDESQMKPVAHPLAVKHTPAATQAQSKAASLAVHKGK